MNFDLIDGRTLAIGLKRSSVMIMELVSNIPRLPTARREILEDEFQKSLGLRFFKHHRLPGDPADSSECRLTESIGIWNGMTPNP